jgi:hypothetical protein
MNTQEKEPELGDGVTSAEYWMYDGKLGRRWNVDPMSDKFPEISPYSVNYNNPLNNYDKNGLEGERVQCGIYGGLAGGIVEFRIEFMDHYFIDGQEANEAIKNIDYEDVLIEAGKGLICFGNWAKAASMLTNSKYQKAVYWTAKLAIEAAAESLNADDPYDVIAGVVGGNIADQIKNAERLGKRLVKNQTSYKSTIKKAGDAQRKVNNIASKLNDESLSSEQRNIYQKQLEKAKKTAKSAARKAEKKAEKAYQRYQGGKLSAEMIDHVKAKVATKIIKESTSIVAGPLGD